MLRERCCWYVQVVSHRGGSAFWNKFSIRSNDRFCNVGMVNKFSFRKFRVEAVQSSEMCALNPERGR